MTDNKTIEYWQTIFENWPDSIQRRGVVVSKFGDSVPFVNFMISEGLVLLERDGPDSTGNRRMIISYDAISLIKIASNSELAKFIAMGFNK